MIATRYARATSPGVAVAALLVSLAACSSNGHPIAQPVAPTHPAASTGGGPGPTSPSAVASSSIAAPHPAGACDGRGQVKAPDSAPASGAGLGLVQAGMSAWHQDDDWAFDETAVQQHPHFLGEGDYKNFLADHAAEEQVGYTLGGMSLVLQLRAAPATTVVIQAIRPVNIHRECVPLALAIRDGNEGEGPSDFTADLEADTPQLQEFDTETTSVGRFCAELPKIEVADGKTKDISIWFNVVRSAYSFEVRIDYLANGSPGSMLVRNGSGPFRTTMDLCPERMARAQMTPADLSRVRGLRYQEIRERRHRDDNPGVAERMRLDPQEYGKRCLTLA